ncbi:hypothetical protein BpHYR1_041457 [Brachionus plicatilis]|uniref:Uncharacterized protein n=1 Tax=Brachionus plicatilis TaxID=10195 RepID=A0A3M7SX04_BRAPC|nr:hypothetical protein BpHYR1_041457 [Brachionus plicatilis]
MEENDFPIWIIPIIIFAFLSIITLIIVVVYALKKGRKKNCSVSVCQSQNVESEVSVPNQSETCFIVSKDLPSYESIMREKSTQNKCKQ